MFPTRDERKGWPYKQAAILSLFAALLLGMAVAGNRAYAEAQAGAAPDLGAKPASPHSNVWCVVWDPAGTHSVETGAPCNNTYSYGSVSGAVAVAGADDEIRIAGTVTETVAVDKPLKILGGFSGNKDQWGNFAASCSDGYDPTCTTFSPDFPVNGDHVALSVQGAFTVTLNNVNIVDSSVANLNGGTIMAFQHGIRLQSYFTIHTVVHSISGRWNIAAPAHLTIDHGTYSALSGTDFVGDGYLWMGGGGNGILNVLDHVTIPRLYLAADNQNGGAMGISGPGTVDITHEFRWRAGSMSGTGVTNIAATAVVTADQGGLGDGDLFIDRRTINNYGTVTWSKGGGLNMQNGATFNNRGAVNILSNFILSYNDSAAGGTFNNFGVFRNPTAAYLQVEKPPTSVVFNNSGNIDVPNAAGVLHFQNGTYNLLDGTTISGNGYAQAGDQTGTWNVVGTVNARNVSLINNAASNNNGISGAGTLNISGKLDWVSGRMFGSGVTNLLTGSSTTLGPAAWLDGRTLNNHGSASFTPNGVLSFSNAATFDNFGVVSSVGENNSFTADSGQTGTFVNQGSGTFTKTANHNFRVKTGITFVNAGTVNVASMELRMESGQFRQTGGVTNLASDAALRSNSLPIELAGGEVKGSGGFNCEGSASVVNTGAVISPGNSPGILTINGPYTHGPGATLKIEIGGATAGAGYDRLVVNGAAILSGTLQVSTINGYTLDRATTYQVLQYQSHSGTFATVSAGFYADYDPSGAAVKPLSVVNFSDVQPTDYFYEPVRYLAGRGIISGYADGTFRPFNNATRGQLSKIIVLAAGWTLANPATATFGDVAIGSTFFQFVETAVQHGIISGYADHTFRPNNNVTRGQLSKIIVLAAGWTLANPAQPTFSDVLAGNPFYGEIETAVAHSIISGYDLPGGGREFRWYNNATRGQIAKIVYQASTSAAK